MKVLELGLNKKRFVCLAALSVLLVFAVLPVFGSGEQAVTIYVTRHGETIGNTKGIVQGWSDSPLTQAGVELAENLGRGLRDVPFTAVYSSDLGRTRQTARLVMAQNRVSKNYTTEASEELREACFGQFEEEAGAAVFGALPGELLATMAEDPYVWSKMADAVKALDTIGTAEDSATIKARMQRKLNEIAKTHAKTGGNVLLVTHGQALNIMLLGLDPDFVPMGMSENAAVSKVVYQNGKFTIESYNDTTYIKAGKALQLTDADKSSGKPLTIYVTRHGRTIFNTKDLAQGWADSPLTQEGIAVAEDLGRGLRDVPFDFVISSDLVRARQTAQLVMAHNRASTDYQVEDTAALREACYGEFEGEPNSKMIVAFTEALGMSMEELMKDPYMWLKSADAAKQIDTMGMAEDAATIKARMQGKLIEVAQARAKMGGNVLLVAHGMSINIMLSDLDPSFTYTGESLANAAVCKVVYENGAFRIESFNDTSYIDAGKALR